MKTEQKILTSRYRDALLYCLDLHGRDTRKAKPVPYVAHLLSVSALVMEDGGDEDEAIAGLLHDALEDHPETTSRKEIGDRFGVRVLHLVESCTDTPPDYAGGEKPPWRMRKEAYLKHLRHAPSGAIRVALADKLHNAREVLADYRRQGDALWGRFNAPKEDQLWFYPSLVAAFRQAGATGYLIDELDRVVSELERLAGAA